MSLLDKLGISDDFNYYFVSPNEFGNFYEKRRSKCRLFGSTKSKYNFDKIKRKRKISNKSSKKNRKLCKK